MDLWPIIIFLLACWILNYHFLGTFTNRGISGLSLICVTNIFPTRFLSFDCDGWCHTKRNVCMSLSLSIFSLAPPEFLATLWKSFPTLSKKRISLWFLQEVVYLQYSFLSIWITYGFILTSYIKYVFNFILDDHPLPQFHSQNSSHYTHYFNIHFFNHILNSHVHLGLILRLLFHWSASLHMTFWIQLLLQTPNEWRPLQTPSLLRLYLPSEEAGPDLRG